MDHVVGCTWLWALVHLLIAFMTAVSTVLVAFIARRNRRVDLERMDGYHCGRCSAYHALDHLPLVRRGPMDLPDS